MKKFTVSILIALGTLAFSTEPAAAFEAHVIGVTAQIVLPTAGYVVINEVYYDTGTRAIGGNVEDEGKNEWIELYNPTDAAVSLRDWDICDGDGHCRNINRNVSILAKGFAVISHDASTWQFWSIPDEAEKIHSLGGSLFYLNNDQDTVILKNAGDTVVDMMSYGGDTIAFDPSVPGVSTEGYSLARKFKGVDTDTAADWEELASPNPGTNPHDPDYSNLPEGVVVGERAGPAEEDPERLVSDLVIGEDEPGAGGVEEIAPEPSPELELEPYPLDEGAEPEVTDEVLPPVGGPDDVEGASNDTSGGNGDPPLVEREVESESEFECSELESELGFDLAESEPVPAGSEDLLEPEPEDSGVEPPVEEITEGSIEGLVEEVVEEAPPEEEGAEPEDEEPPSPEPEDTKDVEDTSPGDSPEVEESGSEEVEGPTDEN